MVLGLILLNLLSSGPIQKSHQKGFVVWAAYRVVPLSVLFAGKRYRKTVTNNSAPVAVQINLFPMEDGLMVVPFSSYDVNTETSTEVGRFVIPWHELHGIIDRMELIEKGKLDVDIGAEPF